MLLCCSPHCLLRLGAPAFFRSSSEVLHRFFVTSRRERSSILVSSRLESTVIGINAVSALRMCYSFGSEPTTEAGSSVSQPIMAHVPTIRFCHSCGGTTRQIIPEGEEKVRAVCVCCGRIHYENPKMVVGCIVEHDGKILLCKRKIQPSYGLWTLPAGYLEIGESAAEGASRETLEEACAEVEIISPFAHVDIPLIGQSYIIFRAKLKKAYFSPGPESLECLLTSVDDIPFGYLAFSSIYVTLKMYVEDFKAGNLKFHYCTINKRPGATPSDPNGFENLTNFTFPTTIFSNGDEGCTKNNNQGSTFCSEGQLEAPECTSVLLKTNGGIKECKVYLRFVDQLKTWRSEAFLRAIPFFLL
ncbi:hypothetical protein HPP92_008846 [Vanilla planifolia]|uniref:Nudix hydrolase domain-containing protein n=1 Tax=Vanilla planifolia TaxID=51239 RepID=A0A835RCQ0_VANPL|nr:hypothetical protein HPP92_008846 [Vanilla planifolia]